MGNHHSHDRHHDTPQRQNSVQEPAVKRKTSAKRSSTVYAPALEKLFQVTGVVVFITCNIKPYLSVICGSRV